MNVQKSALDAKSRKKVRVERVRPCDHTKKKCVVKRRVTLFCRFCGKIKEWQTVELEFLAGGVGYGLIEILWRGRTHWSMVLAGGISLAAVCAINKKMRAKNIVLRAAAGAMFITAVEFAVGVLVNKLFHMGVWNYENMFGNVMGQICPLYSFFWFLLCLPVCAIAGKNKNER